MKKLVITMVLLLVLLMVLPVSAQEAEDRFGRYDETVPLSILSVDPKTSGTVHTEYDSSNPDRRSASENLWISTYLSELNIAVERNIAEDLVALNARINTGMAAGNLPDVMIVPKATFYVMAENGVLKDLSGLLEGYEQGRIVKEVFGISPEALQTGMYDGQMLGFPMVGNWYNNSSVLWIRQDWLDAVNMQPPKTIDEMIAVAKAFREAKLGGGNTIGLGVNYNTSRNAPVLEPAISPYGAVLDTWEMQPDGTYVYANTKDEVKNGLLKLQEMYKAGVIKSDFAVTNILDEEVANGSCGMFYAAAWESVTRVHASIMNDANADWTAVPIPTVDGEPVKQWTNATIDSFIVVNAQCKHPEAFLKMIELELNYYLEPTPEEALKYFVCEDEYVMWNLRVFRNFGRTDADLYKTRLINEGLAAGASEIAPIANSYYQLILQALDGKREQYSRVLGFCVGYPLVQQILDQELLVSGYNGPLTENMTLYQDTINEALTNAMLKVIMGGDASVFDEAVKTWYASGGQKITDEVNAYYQGLK